jgi:arsenate reductase
MKRKRVLFVCTYQGARARIAEEYVKQIAPGKIEAYSSCFDPGKITPLPIDVMREVGITISAESPESVFKLYRDGEVFDYVITLCFDATTELCPVFKTSVDAMYAKEAEMIYWSIPNFLSLRGTEEEKKDGARAIRDEIKSEVISFLKGIGIDAEIE